MKITVYIFIFAFIMFTSCKQEPMKYPDTRQADQEDEYFGTLVADPYRWLEDDNSEETKEWVAAQNEVSFAYLDRIPFRGKIRDRLTSVWDYPKMSAPWYDGGYYFFSKNEGLQNQSVYYILDTPGSEPRIILDPNTFSDDGTVALTAFKMSRNGKYLGYGISRGGSDWQEYMLRYHKFTIGRYWATDYGTSEESREMFEYLYAYSPLHNIGKGLNYPAVLVTTADHDDRVVPAHSFKYMATLQEKYSGKNPVLIRIETQAGHGGGRPTSKIIDELTDVYSFAFYNLGVKPEY